MQFQGDLYLFWIPCTQSGFAAQGPSFGGNDGPFLSVIIDTAIV
jgi:hypothetical protein